ncbi:hypothetical protein pb186bvf_008632 [Paramecium bursaria]
MIFFSEKELYTPHCQVMIQIIYKNLNCLWCLDNYFRKLKQNKLFNIKCFQCINHIIQSLLSKTNTFLYLYLYLKQYNIWKQRYYFQENRNKQKLFDLLYIFYNLILKAYKTDHMTKKLYCFSRNYLQLNKLEFQISSILYIFILLQPKRQSIIQNYYADVYSINYQNYYGISKPNSQICLNIYQDHDSQIYIIDMIFQAKSNSIKFQIELQLQVGQALYITGNIPEIKRPQRLECIDDKFWEIELKIDSTLEIEDIIYKYYLGSYDDFHQFNQELEKEIDRRIPLVQVKDGYLIVKDKIGQNQGGDRIDIVPSKNLVYLNITYQKKIQFGEAFYVLQLQDGQPLIDNIQRLRWNQGDVWSGTYVIKKSDIQKLGGIIDLQIVKSPYHNKQIQNWHYEIQKINQIDNVPDIEQPLYYESIFHNNEEIEVILNNQPQEFAVKFDQKQSPAYGNDVLIDFFQFGAYPLLQNEYDDYQSEFMIPQSSFIQNSATITFRLKSITSGLFSDTLVQELQFDPSLKYVLSISGACYLNQDGQAEEEEQQEQEVKKDGPPQFNGPTKKGQIIRVDEIQIKQ